MDQDSIENPLGVNGRAAAILAGGVGLGALFGAFTNTPCTANNFDIFCGPQLGAVFGGLGAGALTTVGATGVAIFSPQSRPVAVRVAGFGALTYLALLLFENLYNKSETTSVSNTTPTTPPVANA
jgi:hypothetical protein